MNHHGHAGSNDYKYFNFGTFQMKGEKNFQFFMSSQGNNPEMNTQCCVYPLPEWMKGCLMEGKHQTCRMEQLCVAKAGVTRRAERIGRKGPRQLMNWKIQSCKKV